MDLDQAWETLELAGFQLLYQSQEIGGKQEIYCEEVEFVDNELYQKFSFILSCSSINVNDIDWQKQWSTHGLDFYEGHVHIDLKEIGYLKEKISSFGTTLRLQPGSGFGDLSHPTTHLVLKLMEDEVVNQEIVDIGFGSGILGLAALIMGAKQVFGLDIDSQALLHAQANALLNQMEKQASFYLESHFKSSFLSQPAIVLMNMIELEQKQAWEAHKDLHHLTKKSITSGILKEGRKSYLKLTERWGWRLEKEIEQEGWLGFIFIC